MLEVFGMVFFGIVFFGLTAFLAWCLTHSITKNSVLDRGLRVTGIVLKNDSDDYVIYQFTPEGRNPMTGSSYEIPPLKVGSPIEIAYDQTDPLKNYPVAAGKEGLFGLVFTCFYAVFFGLLTIGCFTAAVMERLK